MFLNHFQVNNFHNVYYLFLNYDILIYETVVFLFIIYYACIFNFSTTHFASKMFF